MLGLFLEDFLFQGGWLFGLLVFVTVLCFVTLLGLQLKASLLIPKTADTRNCQSSIPVLGLKTTLSRTGSFHLLKTLWVWVKNRATPKWNPDKRKQGPQPAVPWINFDPCPFVIFPCWLQRDLLLILEMVFQGTKNANGGKPRETHSFQRVSLDTLSSSSQNEIQRK